MGKTIELLFILPQREGTLSEEEEGRKEERRKCRKTQEGPSSG